MHFFNPVHRMPLVEVVRGARTDDETVATVYALALASGQGARGGAATARASW